MSEYEYWSILVQALTAIAGLLVAIAAIWGGFLKSVFAAPKLKLALLNQEGEATELGNDSGGTSIPARYYHVIVSNQRSWAEAINVITYVTSLERLGPDGEWQQSMYSGKVPLLWQYGDFYSGLPSIGKDENWDLGRVVKNKNFELRTKFIPNNFDPVVRENQSMRVHLQAIADNGKSNTLLLQVAWDGCWNAGEREMMNHLIIKQIN